jgi:hypothetical protein
MKLLLLLAGRGDAGAALTDAVVAEADRLRSNGATSVCAMRQVPDDPFGLAVPGMRPFEASIDARIADVADAASALAGLADRLGDLVHVDLSGAFFGVDQVVIPCEPTPLRYQYLMRRRIGTTHESYLDYYFNRHSRFGHRTPGIEGYVQFHIDATASQRCAASAGVGLWAADSVSELHAADLATMLAGFAVDPNLATEAAEDEARFVDRANSVMFISDVVHRA